MKVVVMFPTAIEAEAFDGTLCDVVVCGVGGAECGAATARVVSEIHPDIVVLAGVAGTYSSRYEVGQTVAVCSEVVADMGRVESWSEVGGERFTPLFQKEYLATDTPDGYDAVRSNTVNGSGAPYVATDGVDVENMEGAAFFATAQALGVRSMQLRTISNRVGERFDIADVRRCAVELARAVAEVVEKLQE
ncbi:MAG: hypothetical protein IKB37_00575 [Rikenellaceae bacterium]|nr:hypothetical protein [Rikenellaceae bacterium]